MFFVEVNMVKASSYVLDKFHRGCSVNEGCFIVILFIFYESVNHLTNVFTCTWRQQC